MPQQRFIALDALRGLAIALMILVNTPGSWSHVYSPLLHAHWHGFTFADMVFPGFLFVVGAAMFFSLRKAVWSVTVVRRIVKRAAMLIGIGILLNWFPFSADLAQLRIPGVLQRIGLCYAVAAMLVLLIRVSRLPIVALAILLAYWALLVGFANGDPYGLNSNAVLLLDLWLFGATHLYQGFGIAFDPEGLLSSLPAVVSVLAGYYVAAQLAAKTPVSGALWLTKSAIGLALVAWLWSYCWPINKALWTGSYVLLSSGLLLFILAALVWLIDIKQYQRLVQPLVIYGTNPLFIYILSWIVAVVSSRIMLGDASLYQHGFMLLAAVMDEKLASLLFALIHVVFFWWLSLLLYRRNIIIRL